MTWPMIHGSTFSRLGPFSDSLVKEWDVWNFFQFPCTILLISVCYFFSVWRRGRRIHFTRKGRFWSSASRIFREIHHQAMSKRKRRMPLIDSQVTLELLIVFSTIFFMIFLFWQLTVVQNASMDWMNEWIIMPNWLVLQKTCHHRKH